MDTHIHISGMYSRCLWQLILGMSLYTRISVYSHCKIMSQTTRANYKVTFPYALLRCYCCWQRDETFHTRSLDIWEICQAISFDLRAFFFFLWDFFKMAALIDSAARCQLQSLIQVLKLKREKIEKKIFFFSKKETYILMVNHTASLQHIGKVAHSHPEL